MPPGNTTKASDNSADQFLALAHRLHDSQFAEIVVNDLPLYQAVRDHPDDTAAGIPRGVRGCRHQADTRAAIHQRPATHCDRFTEPCGGLAVTGSASVAGAAEQPDRKSSAARHESPDYRVRGAVDVPGKCFPLPF